MTKMNSNDIQQSLQLEPLYELMHAAQNTHGKIKEVDVNVTGCETESYFVVESKDKSKYFRIVFDDNKELEKWHVLFGDCTEVDLPNAYAVVFQINLYLGGVLGKQFITTIDNSSKDDYSITSKAVKNDNVFQQCGLILFSDEDAELARTEGLFKFEIEDGVVYCNDADILWDGSMWAWLQGVKWTLERSLEEAITKASAYSGQPSDIKLAKAIVDNET